MSLKTTQPALAEEEVLRQQVELFLVTAHALPGLTASERIDVIERTASFLVEVLLPHAALEQRVLYPQAALLLHERDDSEAVADDRNAVRELLARLVSADVADAGALQEVLYALYALLSAHFWREEAVFVKLAALRDEAGVARLVSAAVAPAQ
jgi:hypothetical protein